MEILIVNVIAPLYVGVALALFSHWLDQRKD
ncbi:MULTISPECIES: type I toxin-antitoxin system Fst family toxin [Staphylococcaceae]|uniref:Type I toxin-antitoxin system Fst family toxin n=1 Tax=Macrococcus bovicus TaxID=69968 RepID=A0A4R6C058_9STAP|nr:MULTISPECIES: type I toxin-antitoxin system Fst family toxin [Macrococcus]TDM14403.1 type I toxin-antitoxin system Fst family toxin [Macrococcus bovicus]